MTVYSIPQYSIESHWLASFTSHETFFLRSKVIAVTSAPVFNFFNLDNFDQHGSVFYGNTLSIETGCMYQPAHHTTT